MFKAIDPVFFEQFNVAPDTALGKFFDFQRAGFEAVREIADNNIRALTQLSTAGNPQDFFAAQPGVVQTLAEQNIAVLTRLFQPAIDGAASAAKAAKAVRKAQ